ncbi:hypothetical protein [Pontibacterium sp.]|uniref:hypothetical protein n=1 Tax=Pontibacterium sp. TaxID=2036026 RepID=UPI003517F001
MLSDQQGNPLSGATPTAVESYSQAVTAFNLYRGDPFALLDTAIEDAPSFAMAYILKAYLCATATEPDAAQAALSNVNKAETLPLNEREISHITALNLVLSGNWDAAAIALD